MVKKLKEIMEPVNEILILSPGGKKYNLTITDNGLLIATLQE